MFERFLEAAIKGHPGRTREQMVARIRTMETEHAEMLAALEDIMQHDNLNDARAAASRAIAKARGEGGAA